MRRLGIILLMIAGCADPAALEVRITVRDQALDDIRLNVFKGAGASGPAFIECTLPLNAAPSGTCPFEAGEGQWSDPGQLSFVLYGEPDTEISVLVDGFRANRSVTSTRAVSMLPPAEGERRRIDLALFSRTSERQRCGAEIRRAPGASWSEPDNALAVFDVLPDRNEKIERELVMSAGGNLALARLVRTPDGGCVFSPSIAYVGSNACTTDARFSWCHLRPGAMAVGPAELIASDAARPFVVGGVCAEPEQLIAAIVRGRCADVVRTRLPVGVATDDVSDPVIVDVDQDGNVEVLYTYLTRDPTNLDAPAPVSLLVWHPEAGGPGAVMTALPNTLARHAFSPLVHIAGKSVTLVFTAQSPPFTVWTEGRYLPAPGAGRSELARAPALVASGDTRGVVRVRADGTIEWIGLNAGRDAWHSSILASYEIGRTITTDLDVRVAVGRLRESDELSAVIVDDGELFELALVEGGSSSGAQTFWGMNVAQGAQYALLANIDGAEGSEVVSHSTTGPQIHAVDSRGIVVEGWPLSITSQTGRRHVVITDLDGPEADVEEAAVLRDLEVVTLSGNQLSVMTLGAGSYNPRATPWPAVDRDAFSTGTYTGEVDSHQGVVRVAPSR